MFWGIECVLECVSSFARFLLNTFQICDNFFYAWKLISCTFREFASRNQRYDLIADKAIKAS